MTPTIQSVIDLILSTIPEAPWENSVDTIKAGDPSRQVRGIVTTFMATRAVIEAARELGANFIITHEPTYYNHEDRMEDMAGDAVFESKRQLIEETGITIWRFHDYWHAHRPDGIQVGFARQLGWETYQDHENGEVFHIPPISLQRLVAHLKAGLGTPGLRVVGDMTMICQHVAAMLGSPGGDWLMQVLRNPQVDTLLCGETVEWQVCEYARDANATGIPKAVVVIGHERSEEGGMAYLAQWLGERLPGVPVSHVPSGDPLTWI
jgi:putative NIF3 family GTP cyclohydrolase 1 type 2